MKHVAASYRRYGLMLVMGAVLIGLVVWLDQIGGLWEKKLARTATAHNVAQGATKTQGHEAISDFPWEPDYAAALKKAQKENRPLFVMMTATWCGWCKTLERETLVDPRVRDFMKVFVCVKAYEDKSVEGKYGCNGYPTLAIASKDEQKVYGFSGYRPPGPFIAEIINAYKKLGLEVPEKHQEAVAKIYTLDNGKAAELAKQGDANALMALLAPINEDPFAGSYYLVAEIPLPKDPPFPVADLFWLYGYRPLPDSGVVFLETRSDKPEFRITIPGYEQILDAPAFATGRILRKAYELKPLVPDRAAILKGHVALPDGNGAAGAFVNAYDWAQVRANDSGDFEIAGISPGEFTVYASAPGYTKEMTVRLEPGEMKTLDITLKPAATVHFRWVYQADEGNASFSEGHPQQGEALVAAEESRFSLRQRHSLGNWGSDFMMTDKDGAVQWRLFDGSGGNGLAKVETAFDTIQAADPNAKYNMLRDTPIKADEVFLVKCCQGDHYAKLELLAVTPAASGKDTWVQNPGNGHYYRLSASLDWNEAVEEAKACGGYITTINDKDENDWIFKTFDEDKTALQIGLNDRDNEGAFVWANGEQAEFRNWAPGEPNNQGGNEDTAVVWGTAQPYGPPGMWNDGDGKNTPAVIERDTPP